VVLDNPAETAIVRDGETGFSARSIDECAQILNMLLASPDRLAAVSRNAARHVMQTRMPERSAAQFLELWQGLITEPKRDCDFRRVVGAEPAQWFLATQCLPGEVWQASAPSKPDAPAKGMLAHFQKVFPRDASLLRLGNEHRGATA